MVNCLPILEPTSHLEILKVVCLAVLLRSRADTTPVTGTGSLNGGDGGFVDEPQSDFPLPGSPESKRYRSGGLIGQDLVRMTIRCSQALVKLMKMGKTYKSPSRFQYPENQFFDFLKAQDSIKFNQSLANPTLILQEGGEKSLGSDAGKISSMARLVERSSNEALVSVGSRLITGFNVKQDVNGNSFCEPNFPMLGLHLALELKKLMTMGSFLFRCLRKFRLQLVKGMREIVEA